MSSNFAPMPPFPERDIESREGQGAIYSANLHCPSCGEVLPKNIVTNYPPTEGSPEFNIDKEISPNLHYHHQRLKERDASNPSVLADSVSDMQQIMSERTSKIQKKKTRKGMGDVNFNAMFNNRYPKSRRGKKTTKNLAQSMFLCFSVSLFCCCAFL